MLKNKDIFVAIEWKDGVTSSLPIEMASFLAPGYTFQDKKVISQSEYERQLAHIISLERVDKTSGHYHYYFKTDKGLMKFSGFELARTLFFHNPHLVRAAYTANGLSALAFVNRNQSPIEISFPESTKYPVSFIGTKSNRTHLAWMLLDKGAKDSAFSIFESFLKCKGELGFKFVPPNLVGWLLDVSLLPDIDDGCYEVVRIETVVDAAIVEKFSGIEFYHPKNKEKNSKGEARGTKSGNVPANDIEPDLDLGAIPGLGRRLDIQRKKGFSFNVSGIQNVNLSKVHNAKSAAKGSPSDDSESPKEMASVGIPEKDGDAQEFSPSINQDDEITETVDLPQKFSLFAEVIDEIAKSDGIKLVQEAKCYRFPEPSNNSRVVYQTQYEDRLKYFVAILDIKGSNLILVEADTNNLEKPKGASTLILGLKEDATENFHEILQNFSDKGAQWTHSFINERCNFFSPCRHPSLKEKGKVRTDQEYKEKWVIDLREKLRGVRNAA